MMCVYCEKVTGKGRKITESDHVELMQNMTIYDDFTNKEIIHDGNSPVQYIRKYKQKYFLVTEFANDDGDVIVLPIQFCPMCGRKLVN